MATQVTTAEAATSRLDAGAIVKDLLGSAIVSFLILTPIVTYKSVITQYSLTLQSRWPLVVALIAIVLAARLFMHLFVWTRADGTASSKVKPAGHSISDAVGKYVAPALLIFGLLLPLLAMLSPLGEKRTVDLAIYIMTYVMLAWGLNIVVGLAGLLDLGYVAFYAVGAYTYALLTSTYLPMWFGEGIAPWGFYISLPIAGLLAALWGVILGFPVLRLRGDYLAIVTLAFGEIIRLVLINWTAVTKGTFGVSGIAKATLFGFYEFSAKPDGFAATFGLPMSSVWYKVFLYYLILALCMVTAFVTIRLRRLPIGRAWEALREDEIACRSLGINTTTTKLTAFAIGAMFGGFAGAFFAVRQGFVSPESFVFLESAVILAIVVLGGMGSLSGIAIAAIVMVGGTELLRQMDFLKIIFGPDFTPELYRMLIFGLAMVLVMLYKPRGFVGTRQPSDFLHAERKAISGEFTKEGHG